MQSIKTSRPNRSRINVQQIVTANEVNARRRITGQSSRMGPCSSRRVIHLQTLNMQNRSYRTGNDKFFQPAWMRQHTKQTTKPAKLGTRIPTQFKRLPYFGDRPSVDSTNARETAFIYVQPKIFDIENADIIAKNFICICVFPAVTQELIDLQRQRLRSNQR